MSDCIASQLMRSKVASPTADIFEKRCIVLNCTPFELFRWEPETARNLPPTHALYNLVHKEDVGAQVLSLRELPPEKPKELRACVKTL